jgi:hypothetical protein
MNDLTSEVMKKKEFSQLPESIVNRVLALKDVAKKIDEKEKVKEARKILRKLFSAFLTNKLLKGKLSNNDADELLKKHLSTKYRDYESIYEKVLVGDEKIIIDLGAGVNGLSFKFLNSRNKNLKYLAVEAVGQLVFLMKDYFEQNKTSFGGRADAIQGDLLDLDGIIDVVKNFGEGEKRKTIFLFSVIDALEDLERNYSQKLILALFNRGGIDRIVLSFPVASLAKRKTFVAKRDWILYFISNNFSVLKDFSENGERFLVFEKAKGL